jgi:4-hydroxybenzoate polyprenyltransferase
MPAAAADITDEEVDMRRERRRRRRFISEAVGDPMAIGITVDVALIRLVSDLGLVMFGVCISTMVAVVPYCVCPVVKRGQLSRDRHSSR